MGRHRQLAEEVGKAIDLFAHLVSTEVPAPVEALARARVILVQSVNKYVLHFGTCLSAVPNHPRISAWKEAYASVSELRRSYSEHISRFYINDLAANWSSYRASCQRLVQGMRAHLRQVLAWDSID